MAKRSALVPSASERNKESDVPVPKSKMRAQLASEVVLTQAEMVKSGREEGMPARTLVGPEEYTGGDSKNDISSPVKLFELSQMLCQKWVASELRKKRRFSNLSV